MKQLVENIFLGLFFCVVVFGGWKFAEASEAHERHYFESIRNSCEAPVLRDVFFKPVEGTRYIYKCANGKLLETSYNPTEMGAK